MVDACIAYGGEEVPIRVCDGNVKKRATCKI
jgi:hypothetical protein